MKLIGVLKNEVEKAKDKDEAKAIIKNAGMELTDDELNLVTGGVSTFTPTYPSERHMASGYLRCRKCGARNKHNINIACDGCSVCGNNDPKQFEMVPFDGANPNAGIHF